jgi:hypothetical protein
LLVIHPHKSSPASSFHPLHTLISAADILWKYLYLWLVTYATISTLPLLRQKKKKKHLKALILSHSACSYWFTQGPCPDLYMPLFSTISTLFSPEDGVSMFLQIIS